MNPQTKAWLIVITTALATGCGVTGGALSGGCKTSIAVLTGVGAGASAVLHALLQSPNQPGQTNSPQPEAKTTTPPNEKTD